ncbi:dTMP kinase [Pelagicoccus sp. SDUM812003]|uniref:dTMP kinase n=1 Tax=Pelagicoccus sp. SDUM812003 TaxID=3041267 RepID=UPI00280DD487|nr:dTMP kinase [Pelagicoccus sp. SDUM812003]MDQ8203285.1 dTMP kinase [Pelagicoccus sp. SDUM812003]
MTDAETLTGKLFTFEGSEGSGKSTQIDLLAEELTGMGHEVVVTREPGGTVIGEEIRHLLIHSSSGQNMTPETELLLFAAARAQLVRELILPELQKGSIVLCDRFLDSTTVYQGAARSISSDPVAYINQFAVGPVTPHLTFILDVPAEESIRRVKRRVTDLPDRMEQENIDFYNKVREGYLLLARSLPERYYVVDGTLSLEENREDILKTVLDNL